MLNVLGGMLGLYVVVPVNEAHVRIMGNTKEVFQNKDKFKSDYWRIPFITKIVKLPLNNIRIDVPDVKLNDINMAKYYADIVCFVHISNPLLAAERTALTSELQNYEDGVSKTANDFRAIMESVGRTMATKQTILDIFMNRNKLDEAITTEVCKVFPSWGLELVDLELKDIKDVSESTIIKDIEKKIAAQIMADARVKVAEEEKRASIVEAQNKKEAELIRAETEEQWRKRQIEKDRTVAVAEQMKTQQEEEAKQKANEQAVSARQTLDVGLANVERQKMIQLAEGNKAKTVLEASATATQVQTVGTAEAAIIKAKKVAEGEGLEKIALAQQKFNDAAQTIEQIHADRDVRLEQARANAKAYEKAQINIVAGSTQELLSGGILGNVKLGPKEGVAVKQFLETADSDTIDSIIGMLSSYKKGKKENKE